MKARKKIFAVMGLGNPGKEYEHTRHNAGRTALKHFTGEQKFPPFEFEKKLVSLVSIGTLAECAVEAILPETFMNKSGSAASALRLSAKKISDLLIVLHDDLDLPAGTIKIVKNRGSAGHKGVESVMRAVKTRDFTRIRIGIAKPADIKKSQSEKQVRAIVIGKQTSEEKKLLEKGIKKAAQALHVLLKDGLNAAMNEFNQ